MWTTKCIVSIALVALLGGSSAAPAAPTENNPPPTGTVAAGTSPSQPPTTTSHDEPIPVLQKQRQRLPLRTGGKPLPVPSVDHDENHINENLDLSSGESPNFLFVPILSQNFYFPERSYNPMTRNIFGGEPNSMGGFQDFSIRRNIDNALIDSFLLRQNQDPGMLGQGQLSFTDRVSAFRDWLLSLIPFRIEFVRPGTPRPLGVPQNNIPTAVNLIPNTNIPNTSNNVFTKPSTFTPGPYPQKIVPNQPIKTNVPEFNQNEYVQLQPEVGLTNRNYQTGFNNIRNVHPIQPYPYRPNNVYPYVPANSFPAQYGRSVDATTGN